MLLVPIRLGIGVSLVKLCGASVETAQQGHNTERVLVPTPSMDPTNIVGEIFREPDGHLALGITCDPRS